MKILDFKIQDDFGRDIYLIILKYRNWCLLQCCFSWMEYGGIFPYLNITMGSGRLFYITFNVLKCGLAINFLGRSWFTDNK